MTFTATVAAGSGYSGTPTGTVDFYDGSTYLGTGTLSGGVATFATSALAVGSHSIIGYYSGDGNFAVSDDSGSSLSQTVDQATTTTTLTSSQAALAFDGSNQYVDMGNPSVLQITGPITVSAWVEPAAVTGLTSIVAKWPSGYAGEYGYILENDNGTAIFGCSPDGSNGNDYVQTTGVVLTAGVPTHLVGVYDDSELAIYVNGVLNNTFAYSGGVFNSSGDLTVGASSDGLQPWNGMIGEVRVYDTALTGSQVAQIYNSGAGLATAGSASAYLVGWWKLNEGSGSTAYDSSGNGDNGTLVNSPTWAAGPLADADTDSAYGQAVFMSATVAPVSPGTGTPTGTVDFYDGATYLGSSTLSSGMATFATSALAVGDHTITAYYSGDSNFAASDDSGSPLDETVDQAATSTVLTSTEPAPTFDGSSQYVDLGDPSVLQISGTMSVSAWVSTTGMIGGNNSIVGQYAGAGNTPGWLLFGYGDGHVYFWSNGAQVAGPVLATNTFYNVAATYDGADINLYVNGSLVGQTAYSGGTTNPAVDVMIGADAAGEYWAGAIADVRIYNTALTASQIQQIYNNGAVLSTSGPASSNLVGWWKLNEGTGTTAFDSSGNGNNGTYENSPSWTQIGSTSAGQAFYGDSVTFTATIFVDTGSGTPTGSVSFYDGATYLGSGTLSGGVATYSTSILSVGDHTISAVYGGDTNFITSTSSDLDQTIS